MLHRNLLLPYQGIPVPEESGTEVGSGKHP